MSNYSFIGIPIPQKLWSLAKKIGFDTFTIIWFTSSQFYIGKMEQWKWSIGSCWIAQLSSRVLQTQGNFFLVCIVSSSEVWCITIFPKTKKDLVVLSRQCCLFCLLKSWYDKNAAVKFAYHSHWFQYFSVMIILSKFVAVIAKFDCRVFVISTL